MCLSPLVDDKLLKNRVLHVILCLDFTDLHVSALFKAPEKTVLVLMQITLV